MDFIKDNLLFFITILQTAIFGIIAWFAKNWFEEKRAEKDSILSKNSETSIYILKKQYENEFILYKELWRKTHSCFKYLSDNSSNIEELGSEGYIKQLSELDEIIESNKPFYESSINEIASKLSEIIKKGKSRREIDLKNWTKSKSEGKIGFSISYESIKKRHEILVLKQELEDAIRKRLTNTHFIRE